MHKCHWILKPSSLGINAVYCDKPVKFKIIKDDDNNKYRKYNSFCDEHQIEADKEDNENEFF